MKENFATDHLAQERISKSVVAIHALICSLSRLDMEIRKGEPSEKIERNRALVEHLFSISEEQIEREMMSLRRNSDKSSMKAAGLVLNWSESLPNSNYAIPESTPVESARGKGKTVDQGMIQQFGSGTVFSGELF